MATLEFQFYSKALKKVTTANVILPEIHKTKEGVGNPGNTYKTLYLLHGLSGDHTNWLRKTSIERYANEYGIAVVMPDVGRSWYTDTAYGEKYFTFVAEELPAVCRSYFKGMSDKREDNYIAGLSMGGYGALKLGLNSSDTFSKVVSLSGGLDVDALVQERMLSNGEYWENVFGPADKIAGSENDLFASAERLKASGKALPDVYMWCGTEDFLYDQNVRMRDHLNNLGYNLTYTECPGDHQWKYWDEHIQKGIEWLVK